MRRAKRRTKAQYLRLYDNPTLLAPAGPSSMGAEVILFPNGEPVIWVKSNRDGLGFALRISEGPAGVSLQVTGFVGQGGTLTVSDQGPGAYIGVCVYRGDERSQAFMRWYKGEETEADIAVLGEEYRRAN